MNTLAEQLLKKDGLPNTEQQAIALEIRIK